MAPWLPSTDRKPDEVTDIRQEDEMKSLMLLTAAYIVGLGSMRIAAQAPQPAGSYSGSGDYQVFCASCHGVSGKGDGVIAGSLRKRPANLTQLSKKHEGVFPADAVFTTIETGHEKNDMPAWFDVLQKSQESAGPDAAKARIRSLVKYLETLQPK
jgi:mono/diheme cytochrome c family protein